MLWGQSLSMSLYNAITTFKSWKLRCFGHGKEALKPKSRHVIKNCIPRKSPCFNANANISASSKVTPSNSSELKNSSLSITVKPKGNTSVSSQTGHVSMSKHGQSLRSNTAKQTSRSVLSKPRRTS